VQGPQRAKKSGGSNTDPWRAREHEPLMGVLGSGGQGAPPAADEVLVFKTVIFNASATVFAQNDVLFELFLW